MELTVVQLIWDGVFDHVKLTNSSILFDKNHVCFYEHSSSHYISFESWVPDGAIDFGSTSINRGTRCNKSSSSFWNFYSLVKSKGINAFGEAIKVLTINFSCFYFLEVRRVYNSFVFVNYNSSKDSLNFSD